MGKKRHPSKKGERRVDPPDTELSTEALLEAAETRELALFAAHAAPSPVVKPSEPSQPAHPVDLTGTWKAERSATRHAAEERLLLRVLHRSGVCVALNASGGEICWQMDTRDVTKTVFGLPGCGTLLMDTVASANGPVPLTVHSPPRDHPHA